MPRPPLEIIHFREKISGASVRIGRNNHFSDWLMTSPDIPELYMTGKTADDLRREAPFVIAQLRAMKKLF